MRVTFTDDALDDIDNVLAYTREHYPTAIARFEARLRGTIQRLGTWPKSSKGLAHRSGVRVVPLLPFPYKLFYEVGDDAITILHLHHAVRRDPWES